MGFLAPIIAAISAVVTAIIAAGPLVIIAAVVATVAVIKFVASPFLAPEFDDPGVGGSQEIQQGVLVTRSGSDVYIPIVYGYRKLGGIITFAETGNTDNKYLYVAYTLCEGMIEGLQELFLQDFQMPASIISQLNAGQIVTVSEGKYAGRVKLQFFPGQYFSNAANSTVGSSSILGDAPSWNNNMEYNGLAVIMARYEWKAVETQEDADNNPFGGNIPELQATVLGTKVADISLENASGYTYDAAPKRYTSNPVDHLADYLRNPRYGKGLRNSDFDWPSWRRSALKCNTVVQYIDSGITGPILTSNIVIDTGSKILDNTKTMLATFRGYMPDVAGKYKVRIEDAGDEDDILSGVATIVNTFDEDNIVGSVTYQGIERSAKYTSVKVSYIDPDKKWSTAEVVYPELASDRQVYINKDGGRVNQGEMMFAGITNYAIAKDFARLIFNKSRWQESCNLTVSSEGIELEPGDNIYIQSKMLNFATIPWRVISATINADMTVDLGCVRNKDDIYPHTRVGEEDIVLPPYIPKRAQIYYPAVQSTIPVGLVPPTHATVPRIYEPPFINSVSPTTFSSAGTNNVNVQGGNFFNGITAKFIGNDGTEYTPATLVRRSNGLLELQTVGGMTSANQPYDLKVINSVENGSLTATKFNIINIDNTAPPGVTDPIDNPDIVDPPVLADPNLLAPPEVSSYTPKFAGNAGVNPITLTGNYFRPGISAFFYGKDGTKYTAVSVTRNSQRSLTISTLGTMTVGNQPYSIHLVNESDYGSYDVLITNAFMVDGSNPPSVTDPDNNPIFQVPRSLPVINTVSPADVDDASETVVTVYANNLYPGVAAVWVGNDGTVYAPAAQERLDANSFLITTNSGMTNANEPFGIRMTQRAEFGGTQILKPALINVDDTTIIQPPVIEVPEDPYVPPVTPNPTDPPPSGGTPNDPPAGIDEPYFNSDTIAIDDLSVTAVNGIATAKITFNQPANAMYEKVKGYIVRQGRDEAYIPFEVLGRPGSGYPITYTFNNLLEGSIYTVISRVVYNDGFHSERISKITFSADATSSGDPRDYTEQASTGWPINVRPPAVFRNNQIKGISGLTLTTGGEPRDPRELQLTVKQDIYGESANFDIVGVKFYSKSITATGYVESAYRFPNNYVPGQTVTFTFPGSLGFRTYPGVPTNNQQTYDIVMRFLYIDGKESEYQLRATIKTEYYTGVYNFDPFYITQNIIEHRDEYKITLADPDAPDAARNMFMPLDAIGVVSNRGAEEMGVYMFPPDASVISSWAGVRFRTRPIIAGSDPEFETYTETSTRLSPSGGNAYYIVPTVFEQDREWVITPLYRDAATGDRTDSTESWFGSGYISKRSSGPDIPSRVLGSGGYDWYEKFNWRRMKTAAALKTIDAEFPAPANPTVDILKFTTHFTGTRDNFGWHELEFDHRKVVNYVGLDIYRRHRGPDPAVAQARGNFSGHSRWEKVTYDTVNNSGSQTLVLRPSLQDQRNAYFYPDQAVSSSNLIFSAYYKRGPAKFFTRRSNSQNEFLIVVRTSAGQSTVGLLLPRTTSNLFYTTIVDELAGIRPIEVELSKYNTFPSVLELNLSQSQAKPTNDKLVQDYRDKLYFIPPYFGNRIAADLL